MLIAIFTKASIDNQRQGQSRKWSWSKPELTNSFCIFSGWFCISVRTTILTLKQKNKMQSLRKRIGNRFLLHGWEKSVTFTIKFDGSHVEFAIYIRCDTKKGLNNNFSVTDNKNLHKTFLGFEKFGNKSKPMQKLQKCRRHISLLVYTSFIQILDHDR